MVPSRGMFGHVPVVPERPFLTGDASLVMTAGTETKHIVVVEVKGDREQRAAGFPFRAAPATQRRRIVVLRRPGDDFRPVGEQALRPRRQGCHLAIRQREMAQVDDPGLDHPALNARPGPRTPEPPQQRLYVLPLPQGQGSLRPTLGAARSYGSGGARAPMTLRNSLAGRDVPIATMRSCSPRSAGFGRRKNCAPPPTRSPSRPSSRASAREAAVWRENGYRNGVAVWAYTDA